MTDDEDWFERALRDIDEEGRDSADGDGAESPDVDTSENSADGDTSESADAGDRSDDTDAREGDSPESNPFGDDVDDGSGSFGDVADAGSGRDSDLSGGTDTGESDPFGGSAAGQSDPFGGVAGSDESDPFGGSSPDPAADDEVDFDDDEFEALGGGGADAFGDEEYGFGGGDGQPFAGDDAGPDFDEEAFDSDIDRIDIGIEGLDEMILGGVPERSLMVAIGSAGTGKTTFGLQFLTEALNEGGNAVYITLEESREAILSTAEEKGWPFHEWVEAERLAVVSLDPIEMANSLASIRSDISRLVSDFGADRLVLDSVSLLEMMYDHPAQRRSEVFDFARSLKRAGVTTMLTSEANEENAYTSRYGIVEYLVDAVFILQYVRPSNFRETRLAVEIQKIRDANHSRETKPYEITNDGISVYRQANIF